MGPARQTRNWSWVRDRACVCGRPACETAQAETRAKRDAIIRAEELKFDEAPRMTSVERPLVRDFDLTEASFAS